MWPSDVAFRCGLQMWPSDVAFRCGLQMWPSDVAFRCGTDNYIISDLLKKIHVKNKGFTFVY